MASTCIKPENILSKLTAALSESHELKLRDTEMQLRKLIIDFCNEVQNKNPDEEMFSIISKFLIQLLQSDEKTINEFFSYLQYKEEKLSMVYN